MSLSRFEIRSERSSNSGHVQGGTFMMLLQLVRIHNSPRKRQALHRIHRPVHSRSSSIRNLASPYSICVHPESDRPYAQFCSEDISHPFPMRHSIKHQYTSLTPSPRYRRRPILNMTGKRKVISHWFKNHVDDLALPLCNVTYLCILSQGV